MPTDDDNREVFEVSFTVLATHAQAIALTEVIGQAICGQPLDHDGPCRFAWSAGLVDNNLSRRRQKDARHHLEPIETWPKDRVDRSLGIEE